jgi:branched-chain amino acid transport system ATP-binding protein
MGQGVNGEPILQVDRVRKAFGGVQALVDISFEVRRGDVFGIIGPNGSGKTTLVNCITGFVKMDLGRVRYQGKDITGYAPHRIANLGLTRTFQIMRPYYSLPAYKNLIIPLFSRRAKQTGGWRGGGRFGDRDVVTIDILEEIGFERDSFVPYKPASTLPTGYLKRLELARCLLIEKLQMGGITLVMIEHRLRELFRVAGRVMVLNFGEKLVEGTPEEVMENEDVKRAYLGSEVSLEFS